MSVRRKFLTQASAVGVLASLARSGPCQPILSAMPPLPFASSDVPWLDEVVVPPPSMSRVRNDSLRDLQSPDDMSLTQWKTRRLQIIDQWSRFLGYDFQAGKRVVTWKELQKESLEDHDRLRIEYETHPGWKVEAYLLKPKKVSGKAPGAVVLHPTVDHSIDEPIGLKSKDSNLEGPRALGLHLVRRGFIVVCPRNYLWPTNDRIAAKEQAARWLKEQEVANVPMKGMAKMLYDVQIAASLLEQDPQCDRERLSVVGHSLGAKEVLYAMAFDERFRCGAASEGGIGISFSNWEADWYLGSDVKNPDFLLEHHQILALAAPRPLLIVAGESADGDRGWPWLQPAQKVYSLYGKVRLGQYNHRTGHSMTDEAGRRMVEWLSTYG